MDLQKERDKYESDRQATHAALVQLLRTHRCRRGAVVGLAFGGLAENILQNTDAQRVYGVDDYRDRPQDDGVMHLPQPQLDALCDQTRKRLGQFGDRFSFLREDSAAAARAIVEQLDFVCLEYASSNEAVAAHLRAWYPKIKEGGIVAGFNFENPASPGAGRAVDEFFRRLGGKPQTSDRLWWIGKTPDPITFFMPAYNCARTVVESVESIIATNKREMDELVIVDDGSTDGTRTVLEDLSKRTPGLRLIFHPRNRGGSAARNTACEAASNQLLFCLDSDNLLAPSSIKPLLDAMINSGCDAAAFEQVRYFNEMEAPGSKLTWKFKRGVNRFDDYLSVQFAPGASGNYLFSRESWIRAGTYPESAGALDTWGFGLRQVATGSTIYVLPDSYYNHRYGHDSYSVRWAAGKNYSLIALSLLIPFLDQIDTGDIDYLFSKRGRLMWLTRLEQRPIRVIPPRPYGRDPTLQQRLRAALPTSVKRAIRGALPRS